MPCVFEHFEGQLEQGHARDGGNGHVVHELRCRRHDGEDGQVPRPTSAALRWDGHGTDGHNGIAVDRAALLVRTNDRGNVHVTERIAVHEHKVGFDHLVGIQLTHRIADRPCLGHRDQSDARERGARHSLRSRSLGPKKKRVVFFHVRTDLANVPCREQKHFMDAGRGQRLESPLNQRHIAHGHQAPWLIQCQRRKALRKHVAQDDRLQRVFLPHVIRRHSQGQGATLEASVVGFTSRDIVDRQATSHGGR